jgi:hypothetical protein
VALAAAAVALVLVLADGGGGPATSPRFLPDAFNYRAAPGLSAGRLVGGGDGEPPYSVPYLHGVAASSARSAWAVGSTLEGKSVAWHWDGTSWRSVPLPPVSGQLHLESVAAPDDGEAWAVGWDTRQTSRVNYDTHAVIEHWDGARWQVVPSPYAGQSALYSIAASGPRDVWAVGADFHDTQVTLKGFAHGKFPVHHDRFLLLHWDGTSWSTVKLPFARPPHGIVFGANVAASGPADVWVFSNGGESGGTRANGKPFSQITPIQVEHWNGERWESVPAPFGQADGVSGISSTSADDAWAVGSYRKAGHSRTLAAHWDGHAWEIAPTPNRSIGSTLTGVVAVRPDDVWAVGESQWFKVVGKTTTLRAPIALLEHWDGRRWTIMPGRTPVMDAGSQSIAATEDGTAWAVGSCSYDNVVLRWNGGAWQISPHPPDKFPPRRPGYRLTCSSPGLRR